MYDRGGVGGIGDGDVVNGEVPGWDVGVVELGVPAGVVRDEVEAPEGIVW